MFKLIAFSFLTTGALLGTSANAQLVTNVTGITHVLLQDSWSHEIPISREVYTYSFKSDGTYIRGLRSDFNSSPYTGQWTVTQDNNGLARLRLTSSNQLSCYWLSCNQDIYIAYDPRTDEISVTSENIVGVQLFRRSK